MMDGNIMARNPARVHLGSKSRKGRKKQPVEAVDRGTPELVAKRMWLVKGGDPALATCWNDIIRANGWTTERQWRALAMYAGLRFRLFGMGVTPATEKEYRNPIPPSVEARLRRHYEDASKALRKAGGVEYWNVRHLAIDDNQPGWFDAAMAWRGKKTDFKDERLLALRRGGDALTNHFRI